MKLAIAAALALIAASSLGAQTVTTGYQYATPLPGDWTYAPAVGGSVATFLDSTLRPQLFVQCLRTARQVMIAKPATGAAPFLTVWTTSQTRSLAASYNPATYRLSASVGAFDPLLDAMAFSRGRISVSIGGQPPVVVPAWEELARVIEDCRA